MISVKKIFKNDIIVFVRVGNENKHNASHVYLQFRESLFWGNEGVVRLGWKRDCIVSHYVL